MYEFNKDFENLFDDLILGFGRPRNIIFNSGRTQDMNPAYWTETKEGYRAVCRTVGIDPEDVVVEMENNTIKIHGKTEFEDYKYNASFDIPVSDDVSSNITGIDYKTVNGLTYIYLKVSRPKKKDIKILKIK